MLEMIQAELQAHQETLNQTINKLTVKIKEASGILISTLQSGHKVMLIGNGGSAADAQHIAAELTGRYKKHRDGLGAIALTTDTSALTAISNDYGFDHIFSRQIEALATPGDLLIALSTSGNSKNILNGLILAKSLGCKTLGLSGKGGGEMNGICDTNLIIPSDDTPRIQEMHILIGHILCQSVDDAI